MAIVKPFKAVRPSRDKVALVSSKSYEAYTPAELGAKLDFNPYTFLHGMSGLGPQALTALLLAAAQMASFPASA